jgi:REP element-mobilizing transposase RayT
MSAHSKVDLFVHFVWSTAGRRKILLPEFIEAVHAAAGWPFPTRSAGHARR